MIRITKTLVFFLLLLSFETFAAIGDDGEVLNHFGILRLQDKKTSRIFTNKLRAHGEPIFLIRDFRKGVKNHFKIVFRLNY